MSELETVGHRSPRGGKPVPDLMATALRSLEAKAFTHRAVRHPYLARLADGDLPDHGRALADFARQYRGYARHFRSYLGAVIGRLSNEEHRQALTHNLLEESGRYDEDECQALIAVGLERSWFEGFPHTTLFDRFARATGVVESRDQDGEIGLRWSASFSELLRTSTPAGALGAIGLGTENIVSTIYRSLLTACQSASIAPRDATFFTLHALVDDEHQATLRRISLAYAQTPATLAELERGMTSALDLRADVWDRLLARALGMSVGVPRTAPTHHGRQS